MILSDTPLSPHYIIANCFQPQRAEAVNGYKSRYITRQRSINNAWSQMPQITPRTGVTDISSHTVPVSSVGSRELGTGNSPSIIYRSNFSVSRPHGNASSKPSQLLQESAGVFVRSWHWFNLLLGKLKDFRSACCRLPGLDPGGL